ncbi:MAG: deoxyribodipyrimidine photo-lyase [Anaerolineae bacterium]|nr:deoxyribodipyrimidine photo-lyase [Anaerolineae bacterium]
MSVAIWWVRRDLRLYDNEALSMALSQSDLVIPAFILDPHLLTLYAGSKRIGFLFGGLRQLDGDLRARGSRLIVKRGEPGQALAQLVAESNAKAIFAEQDFSPYARQRDAQVARAVPLQLVGSPVLRPPGVVLKVDGTPYTVFTPFSRKWKTFSPPRVDELCTVPDHLSVLPHVSSLPIPSQADVADLDLASGLDFPPGEIEAQRRLDSFITGHDPPVYRYAEQRDRLDLNGTSALSPYLRFGMLSARQAIVAAYDAIDSAPSVAARTGAESWLNELIWREFYTSILYHFPHVRERSFRSKLQSIRWQNDETYYEAWCAGRTGYPVVDAAMRQLASSGWMHNRARMIVASFLAKDLLIDWRWGERHFMQHLLDGDPAANNGGWQWTAGTGTDAAPYFRVFNPILQGRRYDPQGAFVRRWVPELSQVPERFIHTPWKMSIKDQRRYGCTIDQDYPTPIVDHKAARERALAAYRTAMTA